MSEAAKALDKTPDATRQLFKRRGQTAKVGGRWFVPAGALDALLPRRYDLCGPNAPRGKRISMQELAKLRGTTTDAAYKWCKRRHVGEKCGGRWLLETAVLVAEVNRKRDPLNPFVPI